MNNFILKMLIVSSFLTCSNSFGADKSDEDPFSFLRTRVDNLVGYITEYCLDNDCARKLTKQELIQLTNKEFSTLPTTELEIRQKDHFAALNNLDINDKEFDHKYDIIVFGAIIYALAFETAKYGWNLYPVPWGEIWNLCRFSFSECDYMTFVLRIGKIALTEKNCPVIYLI